MLVERESNSEYLKFIYQIDNYREDKWCDKAPLEYPTPESWMVYHFVTDHGSNVISESTEAIDPRNRHAF